MKWVRQLYDWVLTWAEKPYGAVALFLFAMAESVFFPVPPDVLLIALVLGSITKAWRFALICSIGSIIGRGCRVCARQCSVAYIRWVHAVGHGLF